MAKSDGTATTPTSPEGEAAPRRRTKAPETRAGALMDAAERLFIEKGIATTSIDEIAAGAQVAKGTFYLYFPSKEALLGALQQRFVDSFCARLQEAMDRHRPDNYHARLKAWVETGLETYLDNVALHDVVFHEYRPEDRRMRNDNAVITQLVTLLKQGDGAGFWDVEDPTLTAVILFNALHGVADDSVAMGQTGAAERKRRARALTKFLEQALHPAEDDSAD
ncbi:TetR/AcrR family transcriptional regulator [Variovorax sp. NFACC27]|uniref:TetR/AcrR family transcriptional regulator n=1 Tax=unclassified Variovorax TaxID=663243 RepID=UPI000898F957|nr:AcrR family transcriptional regulator [Variovorax paradoxus]SEF28386.1 transcriptional regulator, TetR family [Variovorax sp. NFACC28]SEG77578.1 transcriptional regulator, TetR family [Variovorax sp. NFACC29]SFC97412.1 transcriptional regulator, TetR family [Variovorax sp. NFACC26]SFG10165.1 transcriptional regulator, TetR family [Variovorax sp. NFACC27]